MKKFALAIIVIAFGAVMVAGCPEENKGKSTNTTPQTNAADNADK